MKRNVLPRQYYDHTITCIVDTAEFCFWYDKDTVACKVTTEYGQALGFAICGPNDKYCREVGETIAKGRAIKKLVLTNPNYNRYVDSKNGSDNVVKPALAEAVWEGVW